jgi:hypothetical protein
MIPFFNKGIVNFKSTWMVYFEEIEIGGEVCGDSGEIVGGHRPQAHRVSIGTAGANACNVSIIRPVQTSPFCWPEVVLGILDLARDEVLPLIQSETGYGGRGVRLIFPR